jgi:signal transduction histidine kinase
MRRDVLEGWFRNVSIGGRIWQLTAVAATTLIIFGALVSWNIGRNHEAAVWVEHTQSVQTALVVYGREIIEAESAQRGYLLTGQLPYLDPYSRVLAENEARFEALDALIGDPNERIKLARLQQILHAKLSELGLTIALAKSGHRAAALAIVREGRGRRYTVEFQRLVEQIGAGESSALEALQANADRRNSHFVVGVVVGGLLAILSIVVFAAATIARIESSLYALTSGIDALAEGNLARRVEVRSGDEIGRVASAFNDMAEHLLVSNRSRERVEGELRRSNEDLDRFAYSASHDLKAPLRGIRNLTDWIAEDVEDTASADTVENLALVRSRVQRLDMLLDSLLRYSRIGRSGGREEDVDLAGMIAEISDYVAPAAGFRVVVHGQLPALRTDRAPLEQVLRNLIGNGLKHHDRTSGSVIVSARDIGDAVEFRVEDDGPGIAPRFHERIFQMFQTLRPRDELEGSGMGLAIVKKTVEGLGGSIRIESAPPRRGTTFIFSWRKEGPGTGAEASRVLT